MKVVGIVCEYNPFHCGHKYMIDKIKEELKPDYIVAIMSGNFVQRGTPAFMDKYLRSKAALNMGVDVVIELPVVYSTASSEVFASAAVNLLHKCGIVTDIVFGSECNDINLLKKLAGILASEPAPYKELLKENLKSGITYGSAKYKSLVEYIGDSFTGYDKEALEKIISMPNNNLGMEYIKALIKLNSDINIHTIKRIVSEYHDSDCDAASYSATALRNMITTNNDTAIDDPYLQKLYENNLNKRYPVLPDDFSVILGDKLISDTDYEKFYGITNSLSNKISNNINSYTDFSDFTDKLKTKEIAHSSIYRGLLHIALNMKAADVNQYISEGYCDYIRILGFKKDSSNLLGLIQNNIPTIINLKKDEALIGETFKKLYTTNMYADNLYRLIQMNKFKTELPNEYTRKCLII